MPVDFLCLEGIVIMSNKSDLNTKMNELYKSMSKGQKLLTNYITDNYVNAAFLTAAKLGETVGVSESTVVPICHVLRLQGLSGVSKGIGGDCPQ